MRANAAFTHLRKQTPTTLVIVDIFFSLLLIWACPGLVPQMDVPLSERKQAQVPRIAFEEKNQNMRFSAANASFFPTSI